MLMLIGMMWLGWKLQESHSPAVAHSGSPRLWIDWLKVQFAQILGITARAWRPSSSPPLWRPYSAEIGPHKRQDGRRACGKCGHGRQKRAASRDDWRTAQD
jgi:hypothetical protein